MGRGSLPASIVRVEKRVNYYCPIRTKPVNKPRGPPALRQVSLGAFFVVFLADYLDDPTSSLRMISRYRSVSRNGA